MSDSERKQRITYHAARHAIGVVDEQLRRKSSAPFKAALDLERQGYVDLANEIASEVPGLETLE